MNAVEKGKFLFQPDFTLFLIGGESDIISLGKFFKANFMTSGFWGSLRFKLIVAFFMLGVAISTVLGYFAHQILSEKLFRELRGSVGNISVLGADLLDKEAMARLAALNHQALTAEKVDEIEKSADYKLIYDRLNKIRDTEKDLIRFVYLLTPTDDVNTAKYLVDADVLTLKAEGASSDDISHFNSDLDISEYADMKKVFSIHAPIVESEYVHDEEFDINSVSGYAPVMSSDGKALLGVLGLDMADTEVQSALAEVTEKSVILAAISLIVSLLVAILIGSYLTQGIITLDRLVKSFADRDFNVRFSLKSNDEVGRLGRSFNAMAETIQKYSAQLEALVEAYGRFVPHDLIRMMEKDSILDVQLGDQTQKEMSVLFSDIRNFTSISEAMSPKENFDFINSYLSRVGPRIRAHEGIIDKYIGDAVMALFPKKANDAIECALDMQRMVREYNEGRKPGYPAIKIGIGIHSGSVMLGTIGEDQRMDGTIISDAVNLASRVEGMTKKYDAQILISDSVYSQIIGPEKYKIRLVDKVMVVGKNTPTMLYELYDMDDEADVRRKDQTLNLYNQGVDAFYGRDYETALFLFKQVTTMAPEDVPAGMFVEKCQKFIHEGYPADWDGAVRAESK